MKLGQTAQIASRSLASSSLATSWTYLANASDRRLTSVVATGTLFNQSTSFGYTTNAQDEATGLTQTSDASIATPAVSSQSASYNNLNQLTNLSGQALTFDADGNLTSDGTRTYSWDAENRLVAIGYPGQGSKATAFAYDGLGRRIQWSSTPTTGGAVITNYIWCGSSLCQARNSANAVIRGYYAEGEYTPGGFSHDNDYAPDRLGSVRRVFTTLSNATYDYDAYGQALQTTAPTTDFGYAGTVTNTDSGLYLTTARPYDPVTGRFVTRDPSGEAGDPQGNLYAYVGGDPVNLLDPEGDAARSRPLWCPECGAPHGGVRGALCPDCWTKDKNKGKQCPEPTNPEPNAEPNPEPSPNNSPMSSPQTPFPYWIFLLPLLLLGAPVGA